MVAKCFSSIAYGFKLMDVPPVSKPGQSDVTEVDSDILFDESRPKFATNEQAVNIAGTTVRPDRSISTETRDKSGLEDARNTPAKDTKTPPVDTGTARSEAQTPRDTAAPTISPGDKAVLPAATNRGTEKASEQTVKPADSVIPSLRQSDVQPALQRPSEAISTQPVARVPDRVPDNLPSSKAEQPSDRALLPGLAIVGPEGKAQQGNAGTVGTSDGKVHDPVVAKPQDLAAKSHDPATAKAQEALGAKVNDTGLRGSEPGTGALTGKIQAGPDQARANDAAGHPNAQNADALARQANGASVLKNYSADGTRSGIDHTNQGIVAKVADGKSDGVRAGQASLNDGKIADGKLDGDRGQVRLPDGRMPDGRIGDGSSSGGRPGEVKMGDGKIADGKATDGKTTDGKTSDGKAGDGKTGDRLPDGKVAGKTSDGGSSGPSAFIQFIESQAGIRGFGLPAKPEGNKSEGKSDGKNDGKADGKLDNKLDGKLDGKIDGAKNNLSPDGKQVGSDTKGSAGIPGGRANAIDGFLGLVETVKDNIKGSFKNLGDRTPVSVPLKEGEMAAVAMRGKMPPLRDDITSDQILAVLIPKGYVGWSIVRSPGLKPSDSPLPGSQTKFDGGKSGDVKSADGKPLDNKQPDSKPGESKPFDINNPEVKSRPFIQLHGVDSNYTGAGARRTDASVPGRVEPVKAEQVKVEPARPEPIKYEPTRVDQVKPDQARPIPVKAEPLTDTKVAAVTAAAAGATPYLDVSANGQIIDQSATRQTIPSTQKDRRQLIEEQEHTLPSASENEFEISDEPSADSDISSLQSTIDLSLSKEGEKRSRYVNQALDAQEETWNSEDDDAAGAHEMPAPLGRYTYIVRAGDTIESVAVVELNDLSLAPLLYKKNKKYVLQEEEYGKHPLVPGVVIDLPTPA
ncbi:MAG: hypothetical protein C0508_14835, partial [Cyanobacteria bacterium PR.023]|nr:hypothetical protein [Cyanobacteria bacterium PR.023]